MSEQQREDNEPHETRSRGIFASALMFPCWVSSHAPFLGIVVKDSCYQRGSPIKFQVVSRIVKCKVGEV